MGHADGRLLRVLLLLQAVEDIVTLVAPRAHLEEEDISSRHRAAVDNHHHYFDLDKTFLECGSPR